MIFVNPLTTTALTHRALHIAAAGSGHILAISREGIGSLLAPDHRTVTRFDIGGRVADVSVAADGNTAAVLQENAMLLVGIEDQVEKVRVNDAVEACLFSPSGKLLWSARHNGSDTAVLEVRGSSNGDVLVRAEVPDPFESSSLMLFCHPSEDRVALWVAAGQDGQCLYWGHYNAPELTMQRFPDLTDTTPPCFDRSGNRFLVVSDRSVRLYEYPAGPELARTAWPLEGDPPAEAAAFVDDEHGVVNSGNGRLFLFNLRQMRIVDEIRLCSHEPRPARELFPNLQSDFDLCSDLSTFMPLPSGEFLSIHRELASKSMTDWRDHLVTWRVPYSQMAVRNDKVN